MIPPEKWFKFNIQVFIKTSAGTRSLAERENELRELIWKKLEHQVLCFLIIFYYFMIFVNINPK